MQFGGAAYQKRRLRRLTSLITSRLALTRSYRNPSTKNKLLRAVPEPMSDRKSANPTIFWNKQYPPPLRLKWAYCAVAAPWSLWRQSSMSFSKDVLLAEIFEIQVLEFFNRIGRKQHSLPPDVSIAFLKY